jgi:hypothetical protein
MSTDRIIAAIRRLIQLWLRNCEELGEQYEAAVPLDSLLRVENVKAVAELDLLREYDKPLRLDQYRTGELVRQWLRERPSDGRPQ